MALVLKSDVSINGAALGDKHGIIGATDWRYMLDFANKEYLGQTSAGKVPLVGDGIAFSRSSTATYIDKNDRKVNTAAINEKRIHYSERLKRNGLLIESKKINHFLNSDAPATQTIQLLTSTLWVMAWVEGSGSVIVSGAGVSNVTGGGVEGFPLIFKNTGSIGRSVLVTVNGNLNFVQVEYISDSASIGSKIHTTSALVERAPDVAAVSPVLTAAAFSGGSGAFLIVADRYSIGRSESSVGTTNPLFKIESTSTGASISAARVLINNFSAETNQEIRLRRFFGGVEQPLSFFANNELSDRIVVSWGNGIMTVAQNGRVVSTTLPNGFTPDVLEIGGSTGWISSTRRIDGIINKVVLYDRQLTTSEMVAITKN